ncbi:MAG TPA: hypothetical protein VEW46_09095 [Pyrinomonadaceae bacterium]|nr:hypothetical protein [Pyrinomonadaceae bacterium]
MRNKFLLVGNQADSSWSATVREALGMLGTSETITESAAIGRISRANYKMIILDAGAVADLAALIVAIRETSSAVPIVVASASPTWQTAREVLMSGADDCIRKTLDPVKLNKALREILSRSR